MTRIAAAAGAGGDPVPCLSWPVMRLLRLFSPVHAIKDFVAYVRGREKHEYWFLLLSIGITMVIGWGFVHDSHFERAYKREIIYVESWPANRSDAEIIAQQQIDLAKERAATAEFERERAKRQAEWKRIDSQLRSWGI